MHNKFIVAAIHSSDGLKFQDQFETDLEELLRVQGLAKGEGFAIKSL